MDLTQKKGLLLKLAIKSQTSEMRCITLNFIASGRWVEGVLVRNGTVGFAEGRGQDLDEESDAEMPLWYIISQQQYIFW